jgi:hypothetical protein
MDIILGVVISFITEAFKLLSKKYGKEASKKIVLGFVFLLVFAFTFLKSAGLLPMEIIMNALNMLAGAVATYQLVTKPILKALSAGEEGTPPEGTGRTPIEN